MKKIVTAILLTLFAVTAAHAENKGLNEKRKEFIRYADKVEQAVVCLIESCNAMAEFEAEPLHRFGIETVGTDQFWAQTTPPATREAIDSLLCRYMESFSEVSTIENRSGVLCARPEYGDNWLPVTEMAVYCGCDFPRIVDAEAGTICLNYIDPGTIAVLTLDAARPSVRLDSLEFRIERQDDEGLRLVMENVLQDGRGVSRRRFIEAVAVAADGCRTSFPAKEYRHSSLGKVVVLLEIIRDEWAEACKQALNSNEKQLKQLRSKFNDNYTGADRFQMIGKEPDRIVREYEGKTDRVEIYYRTDPVDVERTLVKKFIDEDEY